MRCASSLRVSTSAHCVEMFMSAEMSQRRTFRQLCTEIRQSSELPADDVCSLGCAPALPRAAWAFAATLSPVNMDSGRRVMIASVWTNLSYAAMMGVRSDASNLPHLVSALVSCQGAPGTRRDHLFSTRPFWCRSQILPRLPLPICQPLVLFSAT